MVIRNIIGWEYCALRILPMLLEETYQLDSSISDLNTAIEQIELVVLY
jgi:hypothetical protein